jgi:hypothetical protein
VDIPVVDELGSTVSQVLRHVHPFAGDDASSLHAVVVHGHKGTRGEAALDGAQLFEMMESRLVGRIEIDIERVEIDEVERG